MALTRSTALVHEIRPPADAGGTDLRYELPEISFGTARFNPDLDTFSFAKATGISVREYCDHQRRHDRYDGQEPSRDRERRHRDPRR